MRALVDNAVLTYDMVTSEIATQADSDIETLGLAIGAEKDSINYFTMR